MNLRISTLILGSLIALNASLAALWVQAHHTQNALQGAIAHAQSDLDQANHQSAEEQSLLAKLTTDIAGQQTALTNSPGSLEALRRASAMMAIEQLKLTHEKNPPAPRQKRPPSGPTGWDFPELLSDPEYNRLYAEQNRRTIARHEGAKLRSLGLSEELIEKAVTVLAEYRMSLTDYHAVSGNITIPADIAKQLNESNDRQLLEILGDETFKRWQSMNETQTVFANGRGYGVRSREAQVVEANTYLIPTLALRLSYSETPLRKEQSQQLAELLADCSTGPGNQVYQTMYTDAFIQQAAAILTPTQLQALRDFKAEQEAISKRNKLPKSSELPRNTQTAN